MSIESFSRSESNEARLDKMSLVRDEIRNALIMAACGEDQDFNSCMKDWAQKANEEYEKLFEEFTVEDGSFLDRWDTVDEQAGIIHRFEDRIKSTSFKRAA